MKVPRILFIVPGLLAHHPMGALVGQECVRIWAAQFCSMIFSVQYRLPGYYRWLLYEADHRQAYRYHRIFLQHLQSRHPAPRWVLKSPGHLWSLGALLDECAKPLLAGAQRFFRLLAVQFLGTERQRIADRPPEQTLPILGRSVKNVSKIVPPTSLSFDWSRSRCACSPSARISSTIAYSYSALSRPSLRSRSAQ